MKDLYNNLNDALVLAAATRTADATGSEIDLQGYDGCLFVANVGVTGEATLTSSKKIEFEVTECATTGGSFTAAADADVLGAVTGTNTGTFAVVDSLADDNTTYTGGYIGSKRFVKVVANFTGTHSTGTPLSVSVLRGKPRHAPVS